MLDGRGTKENLRARFPTDRKSYTGHYDYEEDSDLEEDDEDDDDEIPDDEPTDAPRVATEKPRNDPDVVVTESSDAKSSGPSDVVSISDLDSLFSESSDPKGEIGTAPSAHVGKVVVIEDIAFVTYAAFLVSDAWAEIMCVRFQALLRHLYTDEIEFAPWGSAERRKVRALEEISGPYGIPKPSPKSIYRLADKVIVCRVISADSN